MALIYLTSTAGSPGVTTSALGLTHAWPRPAILIEADLSKTSSVLPGLLKGQIDHSRGLTPIAIAHQHKALTLRTVWEQTIRLSEDRYLVPGFSNLATARGTTSSFWSQLGEALAGLENSDVDVIIDAGRLEFRDPRISLMQQADFVGVFARPILPDIAAVGARRDELANALSAVGHEEHIGLVLVESGDKPFSDGEISNVVKLPVVGRLAFDPRSAAVYSLGNPPTTKTSTSLHKRQLTALPYSIDQRIRDRKYKLGFQPRTMTNGERV